MDKPVRLRWDKLGIRAILVSFYDPGKGNIKRVRNEGAHRFLAREVPPKERRRELEGRRWSLWAIQKKFTRKWK